MIDLNLVGESIEFDQLINEKHSETMIRGEYLIPDTQPDVVRILMIDAKPTVVNTEVMQDKVYLEGQVEYTVLYFAKDEDKMSVNSVFYTDKFNSQIDMGGVEHRMVCEAECDVEHINANIINERKISVDGIFNIRCTIFENKVIDVVKDIDSAENVQMKKNNTYLDKLVGATQGELGCKATLQVSPEKPEISKILKVDLMLHKQDVRTLEGKLQCSAFCRVNILYKGIESNDINLLEDDIYVSGELDMDGVLPNMTVLFDFLAPSSEYTLREDDLGERRLVDIEAAISIKLKVITKENVEIVEDAYCPNMSMEVTRQNNQLFMMLGQNNMEIILRDNIYLQPESKVPVQVLSTTGKLYILEKKIIENKLLVEGIVKAEAIYRCSDENSNIAVASGQIPFSAVIDMTGLKIDMMVRVKANLENIDAVIEANTLALKAVINMHAFAYYKVSKDFIVDMRCGGEETPMKKSSITIYVVQPGDNLWTVAKKYYITQDEISKLNDLDINNDIKPGDKLLIPGRAVI